MAKVDGRVDGPRGLRVPWSAPPPPGPSVAGTWGRGEGPLRVWGAGEPRVGATAGPGRGRN